MYWVITTNPYYNRCFYTVTQAEWYTLHLQQNGINYVVSDGATVVYDKNV